MKGQNLRIAIKDNSVGATKKYIAGAISFDLDYQCDTEENSTKDSTGGYKEFEATLKSWSGSGQCRLAKDASDLTGYQGWDIADLVGQTVEVSFDETSGTQNRTASIQRKVGSAIITGWKISSQNSSVVNADFSFQGTGELQNAGTPVTITGNSVLDATTTAATDTYTASDSSTIKATLEASASSWLSVSISNGTLSYQAKSAATSTRVAHVYLTTETGGFLVVEIVQS